MRLLVFRAIVLVLALAGKLALTKGGKHRYYTATRGKFFGLTQNVSSLFGQQQEQDYDNVVVAKSRHKSQAALYLVSSDHEPELPPNWAYQVSPDTSESNTVFALYGFVKLDEPPRLQVTVKRVNLANMSNQSVVIIVDIGDEQHLQAASVAANNNNNNNGSRNNNNNELGYELEFGFHKTSATELIGKGLAPKVDQVLATMLDGSRGRLVALLDATQPAGSVLARAWFSGSAATRLQAEVKSATGGAGRGSPACQLKRSKAISMEHRFRSLGLYPNWCTFAIVAANVTLGELVF